MKVLWQRILCGAIVLFLLCDGAAQPGLEEPAYKSGYSSIMKLGRAIYRFLEPEQRQFLSPQPVSIETDVTPFVRLLYYPGESQPIRGVWISAGFIDLANNVAHAKAIDVKNPGYFDRYVKLLASETGQMSLQPLPGLENPEYWTDDMMNEQISNFNSIVGNVISIKLAHHYLGHFEKYQDRLTDENGSRIPINRFLTTAEWNEAVAKGVYGAMNAGCMLEGVIPFFEALDKMRDPPAWAEYFLPADTDFPAMKKEMERLQRKYFAGED